MVTIASNQYIIQTEPLSVTQNKPYLLDYSTLAQSTLLT